MHVASRRERYEMFLAAVTTQCHKYQSHVQSCTVESPLREKDTLNKGRDMEHLELTDSDAHRGGARSSRVGALHLSRRASAGIH